MTVEKGFRTELSVDGVTIDRRDVEMLEAIDRHGSMHAAAEELGRSYARLQRRIVEIEEAVGPVTERRRGGSGGGGTELTSAADRLLRRFSRHRAELDGVATVTESVLPGRVRERDGELATVDTPAGPVLALVPAGATAVEVSVRSDAVVLSDPAETPAEAGTSLRNRFEGVVSAVDAGDAVARVGIELDGAGGDGRDDDGAADADAVELEALVTTRSRETLALDPGRRVVASFKATAARAIAVEDG
ncbi:TOBE domain-containing protein [Salinilacihabitans rarus]|uniref:TOBE domain-containing protein n=1 Tax=Salinilacihabitans rarus TaxID=2961596 RepID=UPI0020C83457|nr:TOBE domain-containing protein [Salinilacihabitans rarus]